ncbi:hypothetical protein D9M69_632740 [compost metagenome]
MVETGGGNGFEVDGLSGPVNGPVGKNFYRQHFSFILFAVCFLAVQVFTVENRLSLKAVNELSFTGVPGLPSGIRRDGFH